MRTARTRIVPGFLFAAMLTALTAHADERPAREAIDRPNVAPAAEAVQRPMRQDMNIDMRTARQTYAMRRRNINERYVRDLGNGCDYVATLHGTIRPREAWHGQRTYRPNLTLDARVVCGGRVQGVARTFQIRGSRVTENDLRQQLASHGRIAAPTGDGRMCAYTPSYAINSDEHIETRAVWQSCSVNPAAIGGGPRGPQRK